MSRVTVILPAEPKGIWDLAADLGVAEEVAGVLCDMLDEKPADERTTEERAIFTVAHTVYDKLHAALQLAEVLMKAEHTALRIEEHAQSPAATANRIARRSRKAVSR